MGEIKAIYNKIIELLPQFIIGFIILILTFLIAFSIRKLLVKKLKNNTKNPLLISFLGKIIAFTINIIGIMMFLSIVGLGEISSKLLAGAGILTFVIGFAFKDIGENFLSGIMLAFKSPFGINDLIETENTIGYVTEVNLRQTVIKTLDGKDVFVPNSQILKNSLINYTVDGYLRYDFEVGLDYETNLDKAISIINESVISVEEVLKDKPPLVFVENILTSTINVRINFWIDTFSSKSKSFHNKIKSKVIQQVIKNLNDNNIYLPADIIELKNYLNKSISVVGKNKTN